MNKLAWKEIVRKTKWASQKKKLTKKELGILLTNVLALEKFMAGNKSSFEGIDRTDPIYKKTRKM